MSFSFTLEEAARITGGRVAGGDPKARLERVAIDSRAVKPGEYFVALKGQRRDGHEFAAEVLARGAAGVIVSGDVAGLPESANCLRVADTVKALQALGAAHREKFSLRVVGVTGSNGKTTTKEMTAHVLSRGGGGVLSTRGNLNSQVGLPLMLMELSGEHTAAVFELGASQKGEIARLAALVRPQVGVITNVGRAHIEFFGSLEGVAEAKWELAASLPADGVAVLNADDPRLASRRASLKCPALTFGFEKGADVRAENVKQDPNAAFELVLGGVRRAVRLPVPGLFNVYNALAAAAVGIWEKVPLGEVVRGLETFPAPRSRMQVRRRPDGAVFVLDAYNANPNSMAAAVESFVQAFPKRPLVAVLGSMKELGPTAEAEHAALGELLAGLPLETVFFVGEEAGWVESAFRKKGGRRFAAFEKKSELREELERVITGDSAVLFKASRSVALEEVYEPLLAESGGAH